jgi:hypothetical protein
MEVLNAARTKTNWHEYQNRPNKALDNPSRSSVVA